MRQRIQFHHHGIGALIPILLILLSFGRSAKAQEWEWQNPVPHGQYINDIAVLNAGDALAVCDRGFVIFTNDTGRSWTTLHIGNSDLQRVLVFPNGIVIAAGIDGLILQTTDRGWQWTQRNAAVAGSNSLTDLVALGTNGALTRSGPRQIMRSEDHGASWKRIDVPIPGNDEIRSLSVQSLTVWRAGCNRNVYKTTDAGTSWNPDSSYAARGLQRLVFIDSSYGYQLRDGQVLRTRDGGATWVEMDVYGFDYNLRAIAGPRLGNSVYILSEGEFIVNKSTDGGATWSISLTGAAFPNAYPTSAAFVSASTGYVVGEGGRILRTIDGGASWTIVHGAGFLGDITALQFMNPRDGIALTYSNTILVSSNGGKRWDEVVPSTTHSLHGFSMYNEREGYAFGLDAGWKNSAVFRTTNAGRSWDHVSALPIAYDPLRGWLPEGIIAVSRDTILVGSSSGDLYRSLDAGRSWDSLYVSDEFQNQYGAGEYMFFFRPSTIIFTGSGGVARSDDMGIRWTYNRAKINTSLIQPKFFNRDEGVALISGSQGGIPSFTRDAGKTWLAGSAAVSFSRLFFFDMNTGFAQRTLSSTRIAHTEDGAATWTEYPMKESVYWNGWYWLNSNEGWAFGPSGQIRHSGNGGVTGSDMTQIPADMNIGSPYPNPFSPARHAALTVPFTLGAGDTRGVALTLHDALGRLVATVASGSYEPGRHAAVLDLRRIVALTPGMYMLRLSAGGAVRSRAVLVSE